MPTLGHISGLQKGYQFRVVPHFPFFVDCFRTGNAYLKLGRLEESVEQFRLSAENGEATAVRSAQDVSSLQQDWADAQQLFQQGQYKECVMRVRKLASMATHNAGIKEVFVAAAGKAQLWDDINTVLKDVIGEPCFRSNLLLRYHYALAFYNIACFDECMRNIDILVETASDYTGAQQLKEKCMELQKLVTAGKTYMNKQEHSWSHEAFTKAMSVDPSVPVIQKYLSACRAVPLMNLSRYEEAVKECSRALENNPYEWRVKALECRALCYEAQGEVQYAIADYERALELRPSSEIEQRLHHLRQLKPKRKDYYHILGVKKDANTNQIKASYRTLALKYHPDRQSCPSEEERNIMKTKFQEISEAYMVLSDQEKRSRYDAGESMETIDSPEHDPFILFNMICGTLPDDATICQTVAHRAKQFCFWSTCCVVGTATSPCWGPVLFCRGDR
eukprot:NODE_425_length_1764_cov_61.148688_g356_i0.p1 GENE.NODE_425_length_1764_cov_61.148688_g356_i0~~NODE_425_length_1764_cov_61.148688_g356_i0.p1  ORF type:complete len:448 (-),score=146.09 NODE_425_length_1764_cov_61.148688_g356_i0:136-1479(-)